MYIKFSDFITTFFLDSCATSEYMPKGKFGALVTWWEWKIVTHVLLEADHTKEVSQLSGSWQEMATYTI